MWKRTPVVVAQMGEDCGSWGWARGIQGGAARRGFGRDGTWPDTGAVISAATERSFWPLSLRRSPTKALSGRQARFLRSAPKRGSSYLVLLRHKAFSESFYCASRRISTAECTTADWSTAWGGVVSHEETIRAGQGFLSRALCFGNPIPGSRLLVFTLVPEQLLELSKFRAFFFRINLCYCNTNRYKYQALPPWKRSWRAMLELHRYRDDLLHLKMSVLIAGREDKNSACEIWKAEIIRAPEKWTVFFLLLFLFRRTWAAR